jgi:Secretion system C-terminal sorting domain/Bacterial Ig-like domain (group 2)
MKKTLLSILTILLGTVVNVYAVPSPYVNIPNSALKTYLLANVTHANSLEITTAEAAAFTGTIDCSGLSITDMTGIAAFTNITILNVSGNTGLTSLSLTGLTHLDSLYTSNTAITSLVVSPCTTLEKFIGTNMTSLISLDMRGVIPFTPAVQAIPPNPLFPAGRPASPATGTLKGANFDVKGATLLTCIVVDDTQTSGIFWMNSKDSGASFSASSNCSDITAISVAGANGATTVLLGGTLQMVATKTPSNSPQNYTWSMSPLPTTGVATIDANGLLSGTTAGDVTVLATSDGNLTVFGTATITVIDPNAPNGIQEFSNVALSVYPNPVTNILTIVCDKQIEALTVVDFTGKVVKTVAGNGTSIDVSSLTSGIYTLQVKTKEGITNSRFVKK